jgi:uncharacterized cofD-like protein
VGSNPNIVVIGGGTGSFTLLSSLKKFAKNITAVVNMVDDGGSTGKLRDEMGVLPPGDVRQCLVALSDAPDYLRELFNFRFGEGDLAGHSFGNLFLAALEQMNDSFADSVAQASRILNVQGRVLPVTLEDTKLEMDLNGEHYSGQVTIESVEFDGSKDRPLMMLTPDALLNPEADEAIRNADIVVIAPGNLYSSLVPALLTKGMAEALKETSAKVVMVSNLVNKKFQTNSYDVADYVEVIGNYIEGVDAIDSVIFNDQEPPEGLFEKYANKGELPVGADLARLKALGIGLISEGLISESPVERASNDQLMTAERNYIRHDADKVSKLILEFANA